VNELHASLIPDSVCLKDWPKSMAGACELNNNGDFNNMTNCVSIWLQMILVKFKCLIYLFSTVTYCELLITAIIIVKKFTALTKTDNMSRL